MTIGPAPMMRMLSRSVRLGIEALSFCRRAAVVFLRRGLAVDAVVDHGNEAGEQRTHFVRPRTCFGVTLKTKGRPVGQLDALQRAVEQRLVSRAHVRTE